MAVDPAAKLSKLVEAKAVVCPEVATSMPVLQWHRAFFRFKFLR